MEVKQCNVCLATNSAYNLICGNCGERLNNTKEKGLSSFENCEVDVLTVYPNKQNGQPGSAIYKNAIVKFIDDFVMINDKMLVPKNNILGIKKNRGLNMSEQKYYVKLKPSISVIVEHDDQDNEIEFGYGYLNGLHEFSPLTPGNTFTKSELAEVMNGALYTQTDYLPFEWLYSFESLKEKLGWEFNETIDKWEYSNPMIELIPVEEVENV